MTQHSGAESMIGLNRGSPFERKPSGQTIDLQKLFQAIIANEKVILVGPQKEVYSSDCAAEHLKVVMAKNNHLTSESSTIGLDVFKEAAELNIAVIVLPKSLMGSLKEGDFLPDPPQMTSDMQ